MGNPAARDTRQLATFTQADSAAPGTGLSLSKLRVNSG